MPSSRQLLNALEALGLDPKKNHKVDAMGNLIVPKLKGKTKKEQDTANKELVSKENESPFVLSDSSAPEKLDSYDTGPLQPAGVEELTLDEKRELEGNVSPELITPETAPAPNDLEEGPVAVDFENGMQSTDPTESDKDAMKNDDKRSLKKPSMKKPNH